MSSKTSVSFVECCQTLQLLESQGKYEMMLEIAEKASLMFGPHHRFLMYRAMACKHLGKYADAKVLLLWLLRLVANARNGCDSAKSFSESILRVYNDDILACTHSMLAEVYDALLEWELAFEHYQKALALDARCFEALIGRASLCCERRMYQNSLADLEVVRSNTRDTRAILLILARCQHGLKQYRESIDSYSKLIAMDRNAHLFAHRARLHIHVKDFDAALADCHTCLDLDPKHTFVNGVLALIYIEQRLYTKAQSTLVAHLMYNPHDVRAVRYLCKMKRLNQLVDPQETIRDLIAYLTTVIDTKLASLYLVYVVRAHLHEAMGDLKLAVIDCSASVQLIPGAREAYMLRWSLYYLLEMYEEAEADLLLLCPSHPATSKYLWQTAWFYHTIGAEDKQSNYETLAREKDAMLADKGYVVNKWWQPSVLLERKKHTHLCACCCSHMLSECPVNQ